MFLVLALRSESGTDALPAVLFAVIAWSDYADGIAARVTGQYSRMGALLDPLVDRMLIVAGVIVCWHFDLLHTGRWLSWPRASCSCSAWLATHVPNAELKINWLGRWGVWPVFSALFFALCGVDWLALACLYVGFVLVLGSTASTFVMVCAWREGKALPELYERYAFPSVSSPRGEDSLTDGHLPHLGSLSDQELKDLIQQLTDEEQEVSYRRRILHGKIDILRAELVNRLRKKHEGGEDVISGADVQRLTDILAGRASGAGDDSI